MTEDGPTSADEFRARGVPRETAEALAVTGGSLSGANRELFEVFRAHGMSETGALAALRGRGGEAVYDDDATGPSGRDSRGPDGRRRSLTAALTTLGEHDYDDRLVDAFDDAVARLEEAGDTFEEALAAVTRRAARRRGGRVPRWARASHGSAQRPSTETTATVRE